MMRLVQRRLKTIYGRHKIPSRNLTEPKAKIFFFFFFFLLSAKPSSLQSDLVTVETAWVVFLIDYFRIKVYFKYYSQKWTYKFFTRIGPSFDELIILQIRLPNSF